MNHRAAVKEQFACRYRCDQAAQFNGHMVQVRFIGDIFNVVTDFLPKVSHFAGALADGPGQSLRRQYSPVRQF